MATLESLAIAEFWKGYLYGLAFTATIDDGEGCGDVPDDWKNPGGDIRDVVDTDDVETILRNCGAIEELYSDCLAFLESAFEAGILSNDDDLEHAGSDFHLTRNRHSAGFWDGDWKHGKELTELARPYGSAELLAECDDEELDVTELNWMVCN